MANVINQGFHKLEVSAKIPCLKTKDTGPVYNLLLLFLPKFTVSHLVI